MEIEESLVIQSNVILQAQISLFLLHGFESLEMFKEVEEEDLDRLGITNETQRALILTAVQLLWDLHE